MAADTKSFQGFSLSQLAVWTPLKTGGRGLTYPYEQCYAPMDGSLQGPTQYPLVGHSRIVS